MVRGALPRFPAVVLVAVIYAVAVEGAVAGEVSGGEVLRMVVVAGVSTPQARALLDDGTMAVTLEGRVLFIVGAVAPCPAWIHTALAELLANVTRRRQRRRDVVARTRNGHGRGSGRVGGTVVMWQRVAVQRGARVYPYARGRVGHGHDGGEV